MGYCPIFFCPRPTPSEWNNELDCAEAVKTLSSIHGYCFEGAVGKTTRTLLGLLFHLAPETAAEMVAGEISGVPNSALLAGNICSMDSQMDRPSEIQQLLNLKLERALEDIEFANCQISYLIGSQREHIRPFQTSKSGSAREWDPKVWPESSLAAGTVQLSRLTLNEPSDTDSRQSDVPETILQHSRAATPASPASLPSNSAICRSFGEQGSDTRHNIQRAGIPQATTRHNLANSKSSLTITHNIDKTSYKLENTSSSFNSLLSSRVRSRQTGTTPTTVFQASPSTIGAENNNPVPTEVNEVESLGLSASLEEQPISSDHPGLDRATNKRPLYHSSRLQSDASRLLNLDSKGKIPVREPVELTSFNEDRRAMEPRSVTGVDSPKAGEQPGGSPIACDDSSPINSSFEESQTSLGDPQSPQHPDNWPNALLDAKNLLENGEFRHEAIDLDAAHSVRTLKARIPNAFGVQWEYTRLTLDNSPILNLADIEPKNLPSCSPHLDLVSFSRGSLGSPVAKQVWKELDLEFLSDAEGQERALGLGKSAHFKNINAGIGDIRSLEESLIGWYGGKVKFSGVIISTNEKKTRFTIKLNPPKIDRSCMFKRKFGSTSFLELSAEDGLMSSNDSMKSLFHFVKQPFKLLGQTWTVFDHDDGVFHYFSPGTSDQSRIIDNCTGGNRSLRRKYHFELNDLDSLLRWYCPLDNNQHLTVAKLASRFKLGRSPTVPALVFETSGILRGDDRYGVDDIVANEAVDKERTEACMTDGNGWMNLAAFKLIRKVFHETRMNTTVQARICGCKGTWTLGPTSWREYDDEQPKVLVRKSQLKIRYDHDLDTCNRILNVVTLSRATCPSNLSPQIIENLSDRGVPYAVFKQLMERVLQDTFDKLSDWNRHPGESLGDLKRRLYKTYESLGVMIGRRRWELGDQAKVFLGGFDSQSRSSLSNTPPDSTSPDPDRNSLSVSLNPIQVDPSSGQPLALTEKILALLRSGFLPLECPYLANKMILQIKLQLKDQIKKFHIPCPSSAVTMIVPDNEGVLKENEVAFFFSEPPIDESGMSIDFVEGDVLLLRHPCLLPTDIRKVTAIHHPALTRYKDVIILPTVGARSLASILGGGDLDGDRAVVIWDKKFVDAFTNADLKYTQCPFDKSVHFTQETIKVSQFLDASKSLDNSERVALFQAMMLKSILIRSSHAKFSMWHVKSCYANGTEHPKSIELAHFVMLLLDSAKSGLKLSPKTLREFSRWNHQQMPTYHQWMKADEKSLTSMGEESNGKYLQRSSSLPAHPLDALRDDCQRARKRLLQYLEGGRSQQTPRTSSSKNDSTQDLVTSIQYKPDDHLDSPWKNFCNQFAQDEDCQSDCSVIKKHVDSIHVQYKKLMAQYGLSKTNLFITRTAAQIPTSASFLAISKNFHHGLTIQDMKSKPFTSGQISQQQFSRLKASCAYSESVIVNGHYTEAKFAWDVAFDDLCSLKLDALGSGYFCVDEALFPALKIDPKMVP